MGIPSCNVDKKISTHAPRTGSDRLFPFHQILLKDFNPRSPHGERRVDTLENSGAVSISTHAPRTGSDMPLLIISRRALPFQPTLPARGATMSARIRLSVSKRFQPTLPARGATISAYAMPSVLRFQPTLPARGATIHQLRVYG